jgi:hypothetical protein
MPAASLVTRLVHHVHVEHAATGQALAPLRASLLVPPPGWFLGVKGADVIVTARDGVPDPDETPVARISLADPLLALRVAEPTAEVQLTAAELVHELDPLPMTLTVELVKKADGEPSEGADLKAHGDGVPPVDLTEVPGEAGLYRSPERVWTSAFHPLELRVADTVVARTTIDYTRADTRVRAVDPT